MIEKWERAKALVKEGLSNTEIQATLKAEYGGGITSSKLAEWRRSDLDRITSAQRQALVAEKRVLLREMLAEGKSGYACRQACRERFGSGVGYEMIQEIQADLKANPPGAIQPVELPADIYDGNIHDGDAKLNHDDPEDLLVEAPPETSEMAVVVPPKINGTLTNIRAIQRWMGGIRAESLTLTRDGRLTMLVQHEFDLGGAE